MNEIALNFLLPILVGFITYIIVNKIDEWKNRRDQSILGSVIIAALIDEIHSGIDIMVSTLKSQEELDPRMPPRKSWSGMNTIPDDVLLRIVATSRNIKPVSFHPREIRIHCKNYFDHMLSNWDNGRDTKVLKPQVILKLYYSNYPDSAKKVVEMLEQTKQILEDNSKKCWPK